MEGAEKKKELFTTNKWRGNFPFAAGIVYTGLKKKIDAGSVRSSERFVRGNLCFDFF